MTRIDAGTGLPMGYPFKPEWEITPRRAREMLGEPGAAILLDCRRPEEWALAKVAGAVFVPMDEVERRVDEIESESGGREHHVAVICHTGRRSLRVAAQLRALGFANAYSVAGGIDLWSVDVDPSIPRY